jgi:hypothetical protein
MCIINLLQVRDVCFHDAQVLFHVLFHGANVLFRVANVFDALSDLVHLEALDEVLVVILYRL